MYYRPKNTFPFTGSFNYKLAARLQSSSVSKSESEWPVEMRLMSGNEKENAHLHDLW